MKKLFSSFCLDIFLFNQLKTVVEGDWDRVTSGDTWEGKKDCECESTIKFRREIFQLPK